MDRPAGGSVEPHQFAVVTEPTGASVERRHMGADEFGGFFQGPTIRDHHRDGGADGSEGLEYVALMSHPKWYWH